MSKIIVKILSLVRTLYQINREQYYRYVFRTSRSVKFLGNVKYYNPDKISIGENVRFNDGVFLNIGLSLTISDGATLSANVFVTDTTSDIKLLPIHVHKRDPVVIGQDVWIGAGAIILPGVNIGDGCVIAAGAVLNQSTGQNEVWIGNPARKAANLK